MATNRASSIPRAINYAVVASHSLVWSQAASRFNKLESKFMDVISSWQDPELRLLELPYKPKERALSNTLLHAWMQSSLRENRVNLLGSFVSLLSSLSEPESTEVEVPEHYKSKSFTTDLNFRTKIKFQNEDEPLIAVIEGRRVYSRYPLLVIQIYESLTDSKPGEALGTVLNGCDWSDGKNQNPHLDISDSVIKGSRYKWVHHCMLTDVWKNHMEMSRFIEGFFERLM